MNSKVFIEPSIEPISLTELKAELNIDESFSDDNTILAAKIKSAREWVENRIGQSLINQTRRQYMDKFPCGPIEILKGPVQSVVVKYYDSNDVEQTWASTNYWFDNSSYIPKIVPKYSYPSAGDRPSGIYVEYVAGYGDSESDVPQTIRSAIKMLAVHLYENRLMEVPNQIIGRLHFGLEALLSMDVVTQYTGYGARY